MIVMAIMVGLLVCKFVFPKLGRFTKAYDRLSIIYYIAFTAAILNQKFFITEWTAVAGDDVWKFFNSIFIDIWVILLVLAFLAVLFCDSPWTALGMGLLIAGGYLYWNASGNYGISLMLILIAASYRKSFDKINNIYLILSLITIVCEVGGALLGFIPNLVRSEEYLSLGAVHTTDFAGQLLFLLVSFCIWARNSRVKLYVTIGIIESISIVNLCFVRGRTDFVCMILLLLGTVWYVLEDEKKSGFAYIRGVFAFLCRYSYLVLAAICIGVSWMYDGIQSHVPVWLGTMVARLNLGHSALVEYPPKLFGNVVPELGWGSFFTNQMSGVTNYFFIDSAYVRMFVIYGLVFFVAFLTVMTLCGKRLAVCKEYYVLFVCAVVAIGAVPEHHMTEFWYNVLPLMLFSNLFPIHRHKV